MKFLTGHSSIFELFIHYLKCNKSHGTSHETNMCKIKKKIKETSSFSQLERYYTTCQQESNEIEINRLISNVSKRMNSIKSIKK